MAAAPERSDGRGDATRDVPAPPAQTDRRGLLRLAGVAGAAALPFAAGSVGSTAAAAPVPALARFPSSYSPPWVPNLHGRQLAERFSYGFTPELLKTLDDGGTRRWFNAQLDFKNVPDGFAGGLVTWYPSLQLDPETAWRKFKAREISVSSVADDFAAWTLMRRLHSQRQVQEVMTEFWSNLLHVTMPSTRSWPLRMSYDATIRRHALGRFDTLLKAAVRHPAMLCYLDNDESSAQDLNENLGRELLELHTVGRDGGYTERDVRNSALILTGLTVDSRGTWKGFYDFDGHYRGRVQVMGFSAANTASDGRGLARNYLHWLAHHPMTARRIAHRLAVHFISDTPPARVVDGIAEAFTRSGTDIRATLRYLSTQPEFWDSVGDKVRTPTEDYIASCRALGIRAEKPTTSLQHFANLCVYQSASMGQRPFDWPRPDGSPDTGAAWSGVARLLGSWEVHHALANQQRPAQQVVYRDVRSWLPALPLRLDAVIDHVSRRVLGRPADAALVATASAAVDTPASETITAGHRVVEDRLELLLAALLDSPAHMTR